MSNYYYSGQGRFYVAERNNDGTPKEFIAIGNVTEASISIETTKFEHKESMSGQRAVDIDLLQEKKGTFTMTVESLNPVNLAMGLWGSQSLVAAGTGVTASVTAIAGGRSIIPHAGLTSVVVEPSGGGTPFVEDTDYTVDLTNGVLMVIDGAGITDGVTLDLTYNHAAYAKIDAFTRTSMQRWLRFEGLNTIDGKSVIIDMFKASIDPLTGYGLINEELGSIELAGSVLFDDLQSGSSNFFTQRIIGYT